MDIGMNQNSDECQTENLDKAFNTTGNANLDFFTRITRNAPVKDYLKTFSNAWAENKELSIKNLLNMRDIRGGKGEKLIPIVILFYLKQNIEPLIYESILITMIKYGCWKDLLKIVEIETRMHLNTSNIKCNKQTNKTSKYSKSHLINNIPFPIELNLYVKQLRIDSQHLATSESTDTSSNNINTTSTSGNNKKVAISLCGKWAPSEKSHYNHYPILAAAKIMKEMGINAKQYRKMLSRLRNHLSILESLMSNHKFDQIDFSKLPSIAMSKMKNAFNRDTNAAGKISDERKTLKSNYSQYIQDLAKGKTKVNIKGLHPHEIVRNYFDADSKLDELIEGQWDTLKKSILESGVFKNVTAIVDVSGSMVGLPMEVSIALGILVAECTKAPFHGKVITFHEKPSWHILVGKNLYEKVLCMKDAPCGGNTNLRLVFDLILQQAKDAELNKEEMVKTLFIFTDMQFDGCDDKYESSLEYASNAFANAGYDMPRVVCWNLRTSNSKSIAVKKDTEGTVLLSGFSSELLKCVLSGKNFTPEIIMMEVLSAYPTPNGIDKCQTHELNISDEKLEHLEIAIKNSMFKKSFLKKKST